jgi:hypothetical protein
MTIDVLSKQRHYPLIPNTTISLFTKPGKMKVLDASQKTRQVYSFGLTAGYSCIGATYLPNHKCKKCYAKKGAYSWKPTKTAQSQRTHWTFMAHKINAPEKRQEWLDVMFHGIQWATRNVQFFRIHDSGDFFNPLYVDSWIQIAQNFPHVHFWSPTSSYPEGAHENIQHDLEQMLPMLQELNALPNVTVRPSCREIGLDFLVPVKGLSAPTGVLDHKKIAEITSETIICPASLVKKGICGTCTSCWTEPEQSKYYILH